MCQVMNKKKTGPERQGDLLKVVQVVSDKAPAHEDMKSTKLFHSHEQKLPYLCTICEKEKDSNGKHFQSIKTAKGMLSLAKLLSSLKNPFSHTVLHKASNMLITKDSDLIKRSPLSKVNGIR